MSFQTLTLKLDYALAKLSFSTKERLALYEMLAAMLTDGLPLDDCLRKLYEHDARTKAPLALILRKWIDRMGEGTPFQEAIKDDVPAQELSLIAAGMGANDAISGLRQACTIVRGRMRLTAAILEALRYPFFLTLVLIGALVGTSVWLLPSLVKDLPVATWGPWGQGLYAVANAITSYGPYALAAFIALASLIVWSMPRWTGTGRAQADKVMPWSIYRMFSGSMFLLSLSSLLKAGVPLGEAVRQVRTIASPWVRDHLALMQRRLASGKSYAIALNTGLLDKPLMRQVSIYSELTAFDHAIKSIGERAIEATIDRVKDQANIVRNVIFVLLGITIVGVFGIIQLDIIVYATKAVR
jgi:type II secretory pathway component PulF